jgi:Kef-type K+ transport system membrane component KefB
VGEIAAGILLGPSALRALWPELGEGLIAPAALPALKSLSQLGVVLFMFLVGLELDTRLLVGRAREAIAVSHASIVAPFVLGVAAALWLYPRYGVAGTGFVAFALFCGAALSVTAFPVLARILADHGLTRTPLGVTAIACAAADDVTAWALLAGVVALAQVEYEAFLTTFVGICAYGALVVVVLRPALRRLRAPPTSRTPHGSPPSWCSCCSAPGRRSPRVCTRSSARLCWARSYLRTARSRGVWCLDSRTP